MRTQETPKERPISQAEAIGLVIVAAREYNISKVSLPEIIANSDLLSPVSDLQRDCIEISLLEAKCVITSCSRVMEDGTTEEGVFYQIPNVTPLHEAFPEYNVSY